MKEGDLEFDFSDALNAYHFEQGYKHSSSSIKPVDFIVEYEDCYRFIEVKDLDMPNPQNPSAFIEKLTSGQVVHSLAAKLRDSYFFTRFNSFDQNKKIEYYVLLSVSALDNALLITKLDQLHRSIPFSHQDWDSNCISVCLILNFEQWQRRFGATSLRRISESAGN